jgi:hypothetical protein
MHTCSNPVPACQPRAYLPHSRPEPHLIYSSAAGSIGASANLPHASPPSTFVHQTVRASRPEPGLLSPYSYLDSRLDRQLGTAKTRAAITRCVALQFPAARPHSHRPRMLESSCGEYVHVHVWHARQARAATLRHATPLVVEIPREPTHPISRDVWAKIARSRIPPAKPHASLSTTFAAPHSPIRKILFEDVPCCVSRTHRCTLCRAERSRAYARRRCTDFTV